MMSTIYQNQNSKIKAVAASNLRSLGISRKRGSRSISISRSESFVSGATFLDTSKKARLITENSPNMDMPNLGGASSGAVRLSIRPSRNEHSEGTFVVSYVQSRHSSVEMSTIINALRQHFTEHRLEFEIENPRKMNQISGSLDVMVKPLVEFWNVIGSFGNSVIMKRKLLNGEIEEFMIDEAELAGRGLANLSPGNRIKISVDKNTRRPKYEVDSYTYLKATPLLKSLIERQKSDAVTD